MYHGSIGARRHGSDNDCIKVVDVGKKQVLHTFEGVDREGAGDVGIHGVCNCISKCGKAEHILHSADFLRVEHAINLAMCGNNMGLHIACGGCIISVLLHVSLVSNGECSRWLLINVIVRLGMVASSSLRSSAWRSVDAGRDHMIWWM